MTAFVHETVSRVERYAGPIFTVYSDQVTMSGGGTAGRDVVVNKNAVVVVALDDVDRVVLIKQYRHAVGGPHGELTGGRRGGHR
jgi:8-oxo-dGDP phosphatase